MGIFPRLSPSRRFPRDVILFIGRPRVVSLSIRPRVVVSFPIACLVFAPRSVLFPRGSNTQICNLTRSPWSIRWTRCLREPDNQIVFCVLLPVFESTRSRRASLTVGFMPFEEALCRLRRKYPRRIQNSYAISKYIRNK